MSWSVKKVALADIKRKKAEPNYGFVEQSIANGTAYSIGGKNGSGYFIVASENSLVPGFVVELALPELAVQEEYESLADKMRLHSLGVLWFDSSDRDACDFVWRLGAAIRSGPPLFVFKALKGDIHLDGLEVAVADKSMKDDVVKLLSSAPPELGGQTPEAAAENVDGRCVLVLRKGKDIVGAAVSSPLPGPYAALNSVVMQTYSDLAADTHEKEHRNLELVFMNMVAVETKKKDRDLVYSMARNTPMGYLEAIKLNMTLVKQSFLANLSVRVHDNTVTEAL
ncbi:MAG TPA: hypothetical protein VEV17_01760 [Bryobacteraceae bacterium]|nr:hypothetical protein [Bryobacteraceae bacterium]